MHATGISIDVSACDKASIHECVDPGGVADLVAWQSVPLIWWGLDPGAQTIKNNARTLTHTP